MKNYKKSKNKKGFTLAEEIVSIVILGILITVASSFIIAAFRVYANNQQTESSEQIGENIYSLIERKFTYSSGILVPGYDDSNDKDFQWKVNNSTDYYDRLTFGKDGKISDITYQIPALMGGSAGYTPVKNYNGLNKITESDIDLSNFIVDVGISFNDQPFKMKTGDNSIVKSDTLNSLDAIALSNPGFNILNDSDVEAATKRTSTNNTETTNTSVTSGEISLRNELVKKEIINADEDVFNNKKYRYFDIAEICASKHVTGIKLVDKYGNLVKTGYNIQINDGKIQLHINHASTKD